MEQSLNPCFQGLKIELPTALGRSLVAVKCQNRLLDEDFRKLSKYLLLTLSNTSLMTRLFSSVQGTDTFSLRPKALVIVFWTANCLTMEMDSEIFSLD